MPRASTLIARPALRRLPTRPSRLVQGLIRRLLPGLFRLQGLELRSGNAAEGLSRAFAAQQAGESTLLIAFRHPSTRDPLVLADLFWNRVPADRMAQIPTTASGAALPLRPRHPDLGWPIDRLAAAALRRNRHSSRPA